MKICPLVLAICLLANASAAQDGPRDTLAATGAGRTVNIGERVEGARWLNVAPVWWQRSVSRIAADWMRFHLKVEGEVPPGTRLVVHGINQRLEYDLTGRSDLWTGLVRGGKASLIVEGPTRPDAMRLTLESMDMEADAGTVYSTHGTLDLRPVTDPAAPAAVARLQSQVAWLIMNHNAQPATCSGFLVADDMLLTNEHCMNAEDSCPSLTALFGASESLDAQFGCAELRPEWINPVLDAALVRLDGEPGQQFGITDLATAADATAADAAFIIQHPGDPQKQVSYIDCAVVALPAIGRGPDTDFTHTCDTASGSSGSPVYALDGHLVGLHHFGFKDSGAPQDWTENRAVRIAPLKAWLTEVLAETDAPEGQPMPGAFTHGCSR